MVETAPATRRAILARPERPFGVALVSGLFYLFAIGLLVSGVVFVVVVSSEAYEDAKGPGEPFTTTGDVAIAAGAGAAMVVGSIAVAWVAAANAVGRAWAWTAVAIGSGVMVIVTVFAIVNLIIVALTVRGGGEAYVEPVTAYILAILVLLPIPFYYRRDEVRAFFGRTTRAGSPDPRR